MNGGTVPTSETTIERYKKSPEEICGQLLTVFADSVERQLAEGEMTEAEKAAIVRVVDGTDLTIRDDIAEVIKHLEAEEEFHKEQGKARIDFGKGRGALARRLKWTLLTYLQERGIKKVTGESHFFRVSKNPVRLVINDNILADEWKKDDTKRVPDRERIEAALDAGQQIDGAYYEQLERLDIK